MNEDYELWLANDREVRKRKIEISCLNLSFIALRNGLQLE